MSLILSLASALSASAVTDTIPSVECGQERKGNFMQRIIRYFESSNKEAITRRPKFSFIGGPHYSSDTKLGIGLLAAGLYSVNPENEALQPSNVTLFANLTTGKYYKVGIRGLHLYKNDSRRIDYELSFNSYSTYYWGIGVDNGLCEQNKSKYLLLNFDVSVDHLWGLSRNLYIGPLIRFEYTNAQNIHNVELWSGQPYATSFIIFGAKLQLDGRDNYTAPSQGWLAEAAFSYNQGLSSSCRKGFSAVNFNLCNYSPVWKSGVIASRLHGNLTLGSVPWCYMPTLGASETMRGYYEGQYRDKNEFDLTVELRQHLYRRSGVVVWGGVGSVFPSFSELRSRYLLPSFGFGYRWEFKKKTNIRVDFGFGKKCWGVEFNIGEAF